MNDELITFLSNQTHMGRFTAGEIAEVLERMKAHGWEVNRVPAMVLTAVDGPDYDAALAGEIAHSEATNAQVEGDDVPADPNV
jgi:hypothetical protein